MNLHCGELSVLLWCLGCEGHGIWSGAVMNRCGRIVVLQVLSLECGWCLAGCIVQAVQRKSVLWTTKTARACLYAH